MNRKLGFGSLIATSALLFVGAAQATMPGEVVADFKLTDHTGKTRSLYETDAKAIVVMIQGNGCPIVRLAMPNLKELSDKYTPQGVRFLLLNSNLQDTRETIAAEAKEFGYTLPILVDDKQRIGEALYVQRTSEVFVIEPKSRKLVYRGPIDDRLSYERQRPATKHYLTDALDATLAGQPVKLAQVDGVGCLVNFPNRKTSHVDHARMGH